MVSDMQSTVHPILLNMLIRKGSVSLKMPFCFFTWGHVGSVVMEYEWRLSSVLLLAPVPYRTYNDDCQQVTSLNMVQIHVPDHHYSLVLARAYTSAQLPSPHLLLAWESSVKLF